jgi:hypothetical protein
METYLGHDTGRTRANDIKDGQIAPFFSFNCIPNDGMIPTKLSVIKHRAE